mgnify:CR=1 FL=1
MNGFSGFGNSPAKQTTDYLTKKTGLGPRAEVKKFDTDDEITDADMENKGDFNISNLHKDTNAKLAKGHDVAANITEGSIESQALRRKKKSALGIENPDELKKLYKTTENPNNKRRQ